MPAPLKTVAILVANPALSSILSATLAGEPTLRVRPFETERALFSYLRVAGADLVVADFDIATQIAELLRGNAAIANRPQMIALASELSTDTPAASKRAGIDEVIMKPMSPRYLVERVLARLLRAPAPERRALHRRDWSNFGSNVVPLFRAGPEALR